MATTFSSLSLVKLLYLLSWSMSLGAEKKSKEIHPILIFSRPHKGPPFLWSSMSKDTKSWGRIYSKLFRCSPETAILGSDSQIKSFKFQIKGLLSFFRRCWCRFDCWWLNNLGCKNVVGLIRAVIKFWSLVQPLVSSKERRHFKVMWSCGQECLFAWSRSDLLVLISMIGNNKNFSKFRDQPNYNQRFHKVRITCGVWHRTFKGNRSSHPKEIQSIS